MHQVCLSKTRFNTKTQNVIKPTRLGFIYYIYLLAMVCCAEAHTLPILGDVALIAADADTMQQ